MYLLVRNALPVVVGIAWLFGSWQWVGRPDGGALMRLKGHYSDFEIITWFAAMIFAMVLADRLWCRFALWKVGVDPMTLHWSKLRNRSGQFFCAACQSIFMLPPEDFDEAKWVHCGDCGHAVAPYGEMKPHLRAYAERTLSRLAWRLRH